MGIEVGGYHNRTDWPKMGPSLLIATALIASEPPPRDSVELTRLATARLGKTVVELEDVSVSVGAGDPDLFAAQLFAKGLQNADLIGDPVDALPSLGILLYNGFTPES